MIHDLITLFCQHSVIQDLEAKNPSHTVIVFFLNHSKQVISLWVLINVTWKKYNSFDGGISNRIKGSESQILISKSG